MKYESSNQENKSVSHAAVGLVGGLLLLFLVVGAWIDLSPEVSEPVLRVDYTGPAPNGAVARLGRGAVNALTIAPNATTVALGGEVGIFVYDADTLEEIWAIPSEIPIISISYSPDGALLAAGLKDGTLALLDAGDGFLLNALGGGGEVEVQSLAWSPDQVGPEMAYLLVAGFNDGEMILSSVRFENGGLDVNLLGSFARNQTGTTAIAFSPNNRILASGNRSGEIFLWDAQSFEAIVGLSGHDRYQAVQDLAWAPDGSRLLSGARDGRVILWDILTFSPLQVFEGHQAEVQVVNFGRGEARMASVDLAGNLINWGQSNNLPLSFSRPLDSEIVVAGWSPGGDRFAVVDEEARLVIWDYQAQQLVPAGGRVLVGHNTPARFAPAVAWSPDGETLATANGNRILLWDLDTPMPKEALIRHQSQVTALAWSPDGARLVSGSRDQTVMVWDSSTGAHLRTLSGHMKGIADLAWSPDGEFLASAGTLEQTVIIWDPLNWQVAGILQDPSSGFASLAWSPDRDTLVGGHGSGNLFFWDFSEGVPAGSYNELDGHLSWVTDLAYSPDGNWVASAGADTRILLWDLESNRPPRALAGHEDVVRGVAFHPDGSHLASGALDHQVMIWDLSRESTADLRPQIYIGHTADVLGVSWSPDGALLATGSQDGTVVLWDGHPRE